jgi:nicotinamidase/pyrazinamidase
MPDASSVLLVVDVQNSFLPGGSLAVPRGNEVVPVINDLAKRFANVVLTQDWHPAGHRSFASSHPGKKPFDKIMLDYGEQILWPDHCVQGTEGARLGQDLDLAHAQLVLRKGYHMKVESRYRHRGLACGRVETDGAGGRRVHAIRRCRVAAAAATIKCRPDCDRRESSPELAGRGR